MLPAQNLMRAVSGGYEFQRGNQETKNELNRIMTSLADCNYAKIIKEEGTTKIKFYQTCPWTYEEKTVSEKEITTRLFQVEQNMLDAEVEITEDKINQAIRILEQRSRKIRLINQVRRNINFDPIAAESVASARRAEAIPLLRGLEIQNILDHFGNSDEAKIYKVGPQIRIKFFCQCPWTDSRVIVREKNVTDSVFFNVDSNLPENGMELTLDKLNEQIDVVGRRNAKKSRIRDLQRDLGALNPDDRKEREIRAFFDKFINCDFAEYEPVISSSRIEFYRKSSWTGQSIKIADQRVLHSFLADDKDLVTDNFGNLCIDKITRAIRVFLLNSGKRLLEDPNPFPHRLPHRMNRTPLFTNPMRRMNCFPIFEPGLFDLGRTDSDHFTLIS